MAMRFGRGKVVACLGLLGWLTGLLLIAPPTAEALSCSPAPGQHIAVVIDFESAPGAPKGIRSQCTPRQSDRMSGVMALKAVVGNQVGFDNSGKVCQIEGVPATFNATNCSAPVDGMVSYWAYFHGDANGWTYSSFGAGDWRVIPQVVEGWHFVSTPVGNTSSAPPPRNIQGIGPSYLWQSTCSPSVPTPTQAPSSNDPDPSAPASTRVPRQSDVQPRTTQPPIPTTTTRGSQSTPLPSVTTTILNDQKPLGQGRVGLKSTKAAPKITAQQVAQSSSHDSSTMSPIVLGGGVLVVGAMALALMRSRKRRVESYESDDASFR